MKIALLILIFLAMLVAALWLLGPREPISGAMTFDVQELQDDYDSYLARQEARFDDIKPGAEKRIVWADPEAKSKTPLAIVYVHGFSATSEEIRPVPDDVAAALGANLLYTRLAGHARGSAAMAEATVPKWTTDLVEAMAIARRIGDRVILMGTSTGGTMITLAAFDGRSRGDLAGVVLISPNFGVNRSGAFLLNMPWARSLLPMILGETRSFPPRNQGHGEWWTTTYPTEAVVPMAAAVEAAVALPHHVNKVPALFIYSEEDQVVRPEATRKVAEAWGGETTVHTLTLGENDDPSRHVIAGDIMSPAQNATAVQAILDWAAGL